MSRHLLQPKSVDAAGNALPGVSYKAYPRAGAIAAISQDAQGVWAVTTGSLPTEATIYASGNPAVNTALASVVSQADGSVVAGYLDAGLYVLIGTVGARNFVVPMYEAGTVLRIAIGSTVAANDDLDTALGKMVTKIETLEGMQSVTVDANVKLMPLADTLVNPMPAVNSIPANVAALDPAQYGQSEIVKAKHSDGEVYYGSNGTTWTESGRIASAATVADPTTMTFTV